MNIGMEEKIRKKINSALRVEHLEVSNDSYKHKGHAGDNGTGETHFSVFVVSPEFEGMSPLQRHRHIFSILSEEMQCIHALSLKTSTKF